MTAHTLAQAIALDSQLVTLTVRFLAVGALARAAPAVLERLRGAALAALQQFVFESVGVAFEDVGTRSLNFEFVACAVVAVLAIAGRPTLHASREAFAVHLQTL